jgi:hypothetical protein
MKSRFLEMLAVSVVLCGVGAVTAQDQAKKEYSSPPEPSSREAVAPTEAAVAAFSGGQFGWIAPNGTWDGKGLFHYHLSNVFWVAKAHQYAEDANYCYYQETTYTSWLWALSKNPTAGQYPIWVRPGAGNFRLFSTTGIKLPRAGDPYP